MNVIQIENLWKEYRLGVIGHGTLTRDLQSWWARVTGKEDPNGKIATLLCGQERQIDGDHFWALRDINLEIKQGEILGIIGKNGAGKSTLLKILSRVTAPSKGKINVRGRIASLLEVGTGFHPELTGRENVYLNGAILGMSKMEVKTKFDEILSFAGIEAFIDTPVKRYSSGMYVRLAFAVAAHLEPEILIIDEVLAVGDADFQKKCLGKMNEVSNEGRTILFVSHNLEAVRKLCTKCLLLKQGTTNFIGETDVCVDHYLDKIESNIQVIKKDRNNLSDDNQFVSIYNANLNLNPREEFKHDDDVVLVIEVYLPKWNDMLEVSLSPYDKNKNRIFTLDIPLKKFYKNEQYLKLAVIFYKHFLTVGSYSWLICINHHGVRNYDIQNDVCSFAIVETGSALSRYAGLEYGSVYPPKCTVKTIEGDC